MQNEWQTAPDVLLSAARPCNMALGLYFGLMIRLKG